MFFTVILVVILITSCTRLNNPPVIEIISPESSSEIIGKEITLTWKASDPDKDTLTFDVYMDNKANPTTKVKADISESNIKVNADGYGTYYWKVIAKDSKGAVAESTVNSFKNKTTEWQKTYGGSLDDTAKSVYQTADGGYIVAGYTESSDGDISVNHGNSDVWIIKLDEEGTITWEKTYGGYIVTGSKYSVDGDVSFNNGERDFWIIKLDKDGNLLWEKTYGGSGSESANSVQQTADGGYIVAGYTASDNGYDLLIIKLYDKNDN